jgi:hypothetical protein
MRQAGAADGRRLPNDGQFLRAFDFEAHDGVGEITLTPFMAEAMRFPDAVAVLRLLQRSPECRPIRADGRPNRPLTAANWSIESCSLPPNQ